jgi:hypothetical protein
MEAGVASTGAELLVSSGQHAGGPTGILVSPRGELNLSQTRGPCQVTLKSEAQVPTFVAGPDGLSLAPGFAGAPGAATLLLERIRQGTGPAFMFGSANGTRLELGTLAIGIDLAWSGPKSAFALTFSSASSALVVVPDDGDGFLQEILPPEGLRAAFDLGVSLSSDAGLSFKGNAALNAEIPVGKSIGPVRIDLVRLALHAHGQGLRGEISLAAAVGFGPLLAIVDGVGLATTLAFPQDGGNLGLSHLGLDFKPPNGVALAIDAGPISGGGYLFYDSANEQYAGAIQLEIARIQLTAIGLLTTRMPDGSKGFSLLISITAQGFQPIQLGLGFRLSGVGGLIGVNRTVAVDMLRSGLKNGTLDAVLFPKDPLRNIAQIVSNLRNIFPPAEGRFVFGPMVIIDWGTPPVITMDLAVILELPSPARFIVIGQIRSFLPREDKALIRLNMDVLGVLELDKGELSIDATLYDSRIVGLVISGDMALRARWLQDPTFVMSIGGLNPNFRRPEGFPKLTRIALSLTKGNNPRVRLEGYLALTSNTAQIGARLDLRVAAAGFSIEGYLSFDALFQFSPFQFVIDMAAGVTLKWHGRTLLGVYLQLTLAGPSTWHAKGKAKFKIWIFSKSVSFDKTFGKEEKPPVLPPADPLPELLAALGDLRSWGGGVPAEGSALVSLREARGNQELMVHPIGRVSVRQRVVPLNIQISKFGNTAPAGERRFRITHVFLGGKAVTPKTVTDYFAPGQFLELTEAQSLTRPSFEQLPSGIELPGDAVSFGGQSDEGLMTTAEIMYDTKTFPPDAAPEKKTTTMTEAAVLGAVAVGAAAHSAARRTGTAKYRGEQRDVAPQEIRYVVASTDDLTPVTGIVPAEGTSYTAAAEALSQHVAQTKELRGRVKVVAAQEVTGVSS